MKAPRPVFIVGLIFAVYLFFPFRKTVGREWAVYTLDAGRRPLGKIGSGNWKFEIGNWTDLAERWRSFRGVIGGRAWGGGCLDVLELTSAAEAAG
jgi:hypothetical protein